MSSPHLSALLKKQIIKQSSGGRRFVNQYDGASQIKKTLRHWNPATQTADQDILRDLPLLRTRSRSLYSNNPIAASAINGTVNSVIGSGLRLNSQVNRDILGFDEKRGAEMDRTIEGEWSLFADNFYCDSERTLNFSGLQGLAYKSRLLSGDYFGLLANERKPDFIPYSLAVKSVEADRVMNPNNTADAVFRNSKTAGGITVNTSGAPKVYHIRDSSPNEFSFLFSSKFNHIQRFGRLTGRLQVFAHTDVPLPPKANHHQILNHTPQA